MASDEATLTARSTRSESPRVFKIGVGDLLDALAKGLDDFNAMPTYLVYCFFVYPIVVFVIAGTFADLDLLPWVFPLLAGYTILGPLFATGTYELSRRREFGRFTSRWNAFLVFKSHSIVSIVILALVLMLIYFAWLIAANRIYVTHFGTEAPASIIGFLLEVISTAEGWRLIIEGCAAGFVIAVVVLTFSVVSFPMLLDLDVDMGTALTTSVRAVVTNWFTMAVWGIIVAALLFIGSLPFFVGLTVVLPVLGHATWHLYRKVVES